MMLCLKNDWRLCMILKMLLDCVGRIPIILHSLTCRANPTMEQLKTPYNPHGYAWRFVFLFASFHANQIGTTFLAIHLLIICHKQHKTIWVLTQNDSWYASSLAVSLLPNVVTEVLRVREIQKLIRPPSFSFPKLTHYHAPFLSSVSPGTMWWHLTDPVEDERRGEGGLERSEKRGERWSLERVDGSPGCDKS